MIQDAEGPHFRGMSDAARCNHLAGAGAGAGDRKSPGLASLVREGLQVWVGCSKANLFPSRDSS